MEYFWKRNRLKIMNIRLLIYLVVSIPLVISLSALMLATITAARIFSPESCRSPLISKASLRFQVPRSVEKLGQRNGAIVLLGGGGGGGRKLLGGLGSSPPRCISKCGRCTPCQPVHVSVPPGTPVTAEYYPEAWRCKCGNKLYMP